VPLYGSEPPFTISQRHTSFSIFLQSTSCPLSPHNPTTIPFPFTLTSPIRCDCDCVHQIEDIRQPEKMSNHFVSHCLLFGTNGSARSRSLDGKSETIQVDDRVTVKSLKASICKKSNFAVMMDADVLPKGEMVNVQMLLVGGLAGGGGGQSKAKKGGKEKPFLEPKKKKKADGDGAASPVKKKSSARKKENPLVDEDDAAAAATQKDADEAVGTQAAATTTSVS
jgi:hypothetical protein